MLRHVGDIAASRALQPGTLLISSEQASKVRKKGKHFKAEADHRTKSRHGTGADVHDMVKDSKLIFGKGPGRQPVLNDADGHAPMWKKKSIFWDLPHWKDLEVRSAIDVMHVTKNLCVTLLGF